MKTQKLCNVSICRLCMVVLPVLKSNKSRGGWGVGGGGGIKFELLEVQDVVVHSSSLKSRKRLGHGVAYTYVTQASLVYDVTDTKWQCSGGSFLRIFQR